MPNQPLQTHADMTLPEADAALFYKLMWALQAFANERKGLFPRHTSPEAYARLEMERKLQVRNALFAQPDLIEAFVRENPRGLTEEERAIVASWRHFVEGKFFIERFLARHAIFIKDDDVFAVIAISNPIEDFIPREALPVYVRAVLLPFKGRIIYDGLLEPYSVSFGGGIRAELKEAYLKARQNGRIIESLEPGMPAARKKKARPARDFTPELDAMLQQAKALRPGKDAPALQAPTFGLVRASLELAMTAAAGDPDEETFEKGLKKLERAFRRVLTTYDRMLPDV